MMGNIVFVIYRPARQVLAAGMRTVVTGGGGTGAVDSVNGQTGVVVLTATDVGADTAGTAAAAVGTHVAASDPHPQYNTQAEGDARYERNLTAGANITIDRTNPAAPVISASGGGGAGGAVDSVNGQAGVVVLDTDDIAEGVSNLYFTNGRAATAAPVQTVDGQTGAVSLSSSYAPLSHVGSGGAAHANAIAAGAAGFMTGADKTKLDGVAAGATQNSADATLLARANHTGTQTASTISDFASASRAQTEAELVAGTNVTITPSGSGATRQLTIAAAGGGGSTNLSTTTSTTTLTVNSDTGTDAVLPAATPSVAGVMSAADKAKLDGVATGATQNSSDAFLLTRGNHTGTQLASTISDFTEATQDVVGASVVAGANVTVTYDDDTGLTTVAATGGGMANPMTTAGDMIVGGASGAAARLAKGTDGQILTMVSGVQAWSGAPQLAGYSETMETMAALAIDVSSSNVKKKVLSANSTFTITGATSGRSHSFTLLLEAGSTYTVTWPGSFKWLGGVPTLTAKDVITGFSVDGGTQWIVSYAGSYV